MQVPPLRERGSDVVVLAERLIACCAGELGRPAPRLGDEAGALLRRHSWPGNVRQLENVVREAVLYCDGPVLTAGDVQAALDMSLGAGSAMGTRAAGRSPVAVSLGELLRHHAGNVTRTARALGVSRPTLYKRMRALGLDYAALRPRPAGVD